VRCPLKAIKNEEKKRTHTKKHKVMRKIERGMAFSDLVLSRRRVCCKNVCGDLWGICKLGTKNGKSEVSRMSKAF